MRSAVPCSIWPNRREAVLTRRPEAVDTPGVRRLEAGLASALTSRGASTTDVMLAGNYKTSRMVAHYSSGATTFCPS